MRFGNNGQGKKMIKEKITSPIGSYKYKKERHKQNLNNNIKTQV